MPTTSQRRPAERTRIALSARLTWKEPSGAVRFASVTTRDVSESGAFVEADCPVAIPLYRLVRLQIERDARNSMPMPPSLRAGAVLSAVWRVGPCRRSTGTPDGYALRFLVDSPELAARDQAPALRMAAAS